MLILFAMQAKLQNDLSSVVLLVAESNNLRASKSIVLFRYGN